MSYEYHPKEGFAIKINIKGFDPDDINIQTDDRYVLVTAEHEEQLENGGYLARHFAQRYLLPRSINAEALTSNMSDDGILTIHAPVNQNRNQIQDSREQYNEEGPAYNRDYNSQSNDGPAYNEGYNSQSNDGPAYNEGYNSQSNDGPAYNEGYNSQSNDGPAYNEGYNSQSNDGPAYNDEYNSQSNVEEPAFSEDYNSQLNVESPDANIEDYNSELNEESPDAYSEDYDSQS